MIATLRRRFRYNGWANRMMVDALAETGMPPEIAVGRMAHIISAERIWLNRIRDEAQPFPVFPDWSIDECNRNLEHTARLWTEYFEIVTDGELLREYNYKSTTGSSHHGGVLDSLLHVITHSAYHRGQIAADMRQAGFDPPGTDYIIAVRLGILDD